jgi:hypothetical protein
VQLPWIEHGLRYMVILILWKVFEDIGEFVWMMEVDVS